MKVQEFVSFVFILETESYSERSVHLFSSHFPSHLLFTYFSLFSFYLLFPSLLHSFPFHPLFHTPPAALDLALSPFLLCHCITCLAECPSQFSVLKIYIFYFFNANLLLQYSKHQKKISSYILQSHSCRLLLS